MDLGAKGWLGDYIEYRKENYGKQSFVVTRHPDFSLYHLLQPTGILYGNPLQPETLDKSDFDNLDEVSRMQVLLAESLINTSLLFQKDEIHSFEDYEVKLSAAISYISNFYNKVYPEIATSGKSFLGKKKPDVEVAERLIEKRVALKRKSEPNFWIQFFENTLMFLDIYFFAQWIHTTADKVVTEFFREEKEELRLTVIKVIVAAAYANDIIEVEERKLFGYILDVADLSAKRKKDAIALLDQGILVEEITIPENNSWLLKKYLLELAILTVSADRVVDDREREFLVNFAKHLGFFEEDLEDSIIAFEGFVVENWDQIGELQNRKDYGQITDEYDGRISLLLKKHTKKISTEIQQNEAALRLYEKFNDGSITEEDTERLGEMLLNIIQKLPSFSSFSLPKTFLTTDHLMKILPEITIDDGQQT